MGEQVPAESLDDVGGIEGWFPVGGGDLKHVDSLLGYYLYRLLGRKPSAGLPNLQE